MAGSRRGQGIPTQLGLALFEQFVLPHLSVGSRGPAPKLGLLVVGLSRWYGYVDAFLKARMSFLRF
jgi:hypothetical protein